MFHIVRGAVVHKILYFTNGHIELAQEQDGFQQGTLMVIVTAVSVFGMNGGRLKQPDLVIPHQGFFINPVHGRKLADGEKLVFFIHKICLLRF